MNKKIISFFIIITIYLFINIVSADPLPCSDVSQFDNCGLEAGDFTGWTVPLELPSDIAVTPDAAYYDNYGAVLKPADILNSDGYAYNYPSFSTGHVDLSSHGNISRISFWYKINKAQVSGSGVTELRIFVPVGGEGILVLIDDINPSETDWGYYNINGEDLYAYLEETQPGWDFAPSFYISYEGATYKPEEGDGTASLEVFIDEVTITFDDVSPTPTPTPMFQTFQEKINSKVNDIQTTIIVGIYLTIGAIIVMIIATIFGRSGG